MIIGIAAGGVLGYYDARLEAAVNNKNGSTLTDVKVDDNLTFNKNVINILLVGSDHGGRSKVITEDRQYHDRNSQF